MSVAEPKGGCYCPSCERTFATGDRCPYDGSRLVRIGSPDLVGRELDGRYLILEKLGEGAMGTVYRADQHAVGRGVAIKVMAPTLVSDPVVVKRFLREARLASRLNHPHAMSVLDFGQTDDGLFFLVMELLEGKTLEREIADRGALAPDRVVRIGVQILDALDGAHSLQIVHRDLKPSNVMLLAGGEDRVKVLDFGLAKSLLPDMQGATMTNANALVGTPAFMPPELVTGRETDERADLYSLGCVLYTAVMGDQPFVASTVHELIAMHASEPPPPMVGVPGGLALVIGKLLEKEPDRRYRSATKAREALEVALGGAPSHPHDPTLVNPPSRSVVPTALGWGSSLAQPSSTVRAVRRPAPSPPPPAPTPPPAVPEPVSSEEISAPTKLFRASEPPRPAPARPRTRVRRAWPWVVLLVVVIAAVAALSFAL